MPDWNEVFNEIRQEIQDQEQRAASAKKAARSAVDKTRRNYLQKLFEYTGRNVIAYYSGFLSKPGIPTDQINDEDKNGFMMAVHNLERDKGLDLILHTGGGNIAATQSIVDYLHKMFGNDIRAIVPQIAMSAGTMLACSCKSIVMAKHSNLGPIDPHLNGYPAHGVIDEFRRACRDVKRDSSTAMVWANIIGQYQPGFLGQCKNAIEWSEAFVREQLETVMFEDMSRAGAKKKAAAIVKKLSDYRGNKTHSRHIPSEESRAIGLKIVDLEDDDEFQDLVLTVHHCYMHSLMNTASFKMIENHLPTAFIKQTAVQQQPAG